MPSANFIDMLALLDAKRTGARAWVACCPSHDDHSPSLTIYEGKEGQPLFVCGRCDWREVRDALRARGCKVVAKKKRGEKAEESAPSLPSSAGAPAPDYGAAARKLWANTVSGAGTLVEKYLRHRGLSAALDADRSILSRVLRFHGACPRGRGREVRYLPAMVALVRDIVTDAPVAIHRTFLTADARKDGKPMMLGPCEHAAVKLAAHAHCFPEPFLLCRKLHVAEGIETGLAAMVLGHTPMWALGSAGAIERLPVLDDVVELVVCADADAVGTRSGMIAIGRWHAAGVSTRMLMPGSPGSGLDFADLVL